jgi:histidinol-phosphatase
VSRRIKAERARVAAALRRQRGVLKVWPSEANFLLVEFQDAAAAAANAHAAGLLVRDMRAAPASRGAAHQHRQPRTERSAAREPAMMPLRCARAGAVRRPRRHADRGAADNQVDRLDKLRLLPGVFAALSELRRAGYRLVMVSNQDGLGSERYPREHFEQVQDFVLRLFASQGIEFDAGVHLPAFEHEQCACRKPRTGLVTEYLQQHRSTGRAAP